jgi:hypothetical protein
VLVALIASSDRALLEQLSIAVVQDMADGSFGIEFIRPLDPRARFSKAVATAEFTDEDGTPVSVALHVERGCRLMELDFFKADFSALRTYPTPDQLVMKVPTVAPARKESRWEVLLQFWRDDIPLEDLRKCVIRRVAIMIGIWVMWFPLKILSMIIDVLMTGAHGGGSRRAVTSYGAAFCIWWHLVSQS